MKLQRWRVVIEWTDSNQSKNPITAGFYEYEYTGSEGEGAQLCNTYRGHIDATVNSKRHWISKRKCNFQPGRQDSLYSSPVAGYDLEHDSMHNISMFSRTNDPSELIRCKNPSRPYSAVNTCTFKINKSWRSTDVFSKHVRTKNVSGNSIPITLFLKVNGWAKSDFNSFYRFVSVVSTALISMEMITEPEFYYISISRAS